MANETVITVVGNLTADPELRFTPNGAAVANFTIASTPRTFNRQTQQWEDGEPLFLRSSIWKEAAENVAATLPKGMRVIAQGRLKQRSFEDREGNKRTSYELDVDEIGPSLQWATAQVTRASRGTGGGNGNGRPPVGSPAPSNGGQGTGWGQNGGNGYGGPPAPPQDPRSNGGWDTPGPNGPSF